MFDSYDFDELQRLAQDNPDKLEQLRIQWSEQLIQSAPKTYRRKLRGLQFQIDMNRRKAKTPLAACISLSGMMHDSFDRLRASLNEATEVFDQEPPLSSDHQDTLEMATILPFKRA